MKRWGQVHIRKGKNQTHGDRKNITQYIIRVSTPFWTSLKSNEVFSIWWKNCWIVGDLEWVLRQFCLSQNLSHFLFCHLLTDSFKKFPSLMCDHFLHLPWEFLWLTFYCPSHSWRHSWCNGYHCKKWTQRHKFKSLARLFTFHIALKLSGKI